MIGCAINSRQGTNRPIGGSSEIIEPQTNLIISKFELRETDSLYYDDMVAENEGDISINVFQVSTPFFHRPILYFEIIKPGLFEVSVSELNGSELALIQEKHLFEGKYEITLAGSWPSGLYICVITKDGVTQVTRKILLVK